MSDVVARWCGYSWHDGLRLVLPRPHWAKEMPNMVGGEELYQYLHKAYETDLRKITDTLVQKYQGNISLIGGLFGTNHHRELFTKVVSIKG